jgi:hypothetical protein
MIDPFPKKKVIDCDRIREIHRTRFESFVSMTNDETEWRGFNAKMEEITSQSRTMNSKLVFEPLTGTCASSFAPFDRIVSRPFPSGGDDPSS